MTNKTDDCVVRVQELILTICELCRGSSVLWDLPAHIDRRFEHVTCCCKIYSMNSQRRTEGMAFVCGNKHPAGNRVRRKLYGANHQGRQDVGLRV